jgi:hypothetical protein
LRFSDIDYDRHRYNSVTDIIYEYVEKRIKYKGPSLNNYEYDYDHDERNIYEYKYFAENANDEENTIDTNINYSDPYTFDNDGIDFDRRRIFDIWDGIEARCDQDRPKNIVEINMLMDEYKDLTEGDKTLIKYMIMIYAINNMHKWVDTSSKLSAPGKETQNKETLNKEILDKNITSYTINKILSSLYRNTLNPKQTERILKVCASVKNDIYEYLKNKYITHVDVEIMCDNRLEKYPELPHDERTAVLLLLFEYTLSACAIVYPTTRYIRNQEILTYHTPSTAAMLEDACNKMINEQEDQQNNQEEEQQQEEQQQEEQEG